MGILGGLGSKLFEGRFYRGSCRGTTIGVTNGMTHFRSTRTEYFTGMRDEYDHWMGTQ